MLPRSYSLIIFALLMNWAIVLYQIFKVGAARMKYGIKYPQLYENKEGSQFDRVQRAHQSTLEWNTHFLVFLLIGGLSCPLSSAVAGVVYNIGRVVHAKGYYQGSAHKGLWSLYALMYLAGTTGYTAYKVGVTYQL